MESSSKKFTPLFFTLLLILFVLFIILVLLGNRNSTPNTSFNDSSIQAAEFLNQASRDDISHGERVEISNNLSETSNFERKPELTPERIAEVEALLSS